MKTWKIHPITLYLGKRIPLNLKMLCHSVGLTAQSDYVQVSNCVRHCKPMGDRLAKPLAKYAKEITLTDLRAGFVEVART